MLRRSQASPEAASGNPTLRNLSNAKRRVPLEPECGCGQGGTALRFCPRHYKDKYVGAVIWPNG